MVCIMAMSVLYGGQPTSASSPRMDAGTAVSKTVGRVLVWDDDDKTTDYVPREALSGVKAVAVGGGWMPGITWSVPNLALKRGKVIAWTRFSAVPVPDEWLSGVSAIAAGGTAALALKRGRVVAWKGTGARLEPVPDEVLSGVSAIAAGRDHFLALKDGAVIAWGSNDFGQSSVPEVARSGVTAIAAGDSHVLAVKRGGVVAWGDNQFGQGRVPAVARAGVTAIAAGYSHSLALKGGRVIAWGQGYSKLPRYGAAPRHISSVSVPKEARSRVAAIAAHGNISLAIRKD